jgi:hypothetical protein
MGQKGSECAGDASGVAGPSTAVDASAPTYAQDDGIIWCEEIAGLGFLA